MLKSRLPQIALQIDIVVEEAIEAGAEQVADSARVRVGPHRVTGRLEDAIHVEEESEGFYVVAGGGDEDVFWGHLLENGTSHSAPYPFLVPSLEENRSDVVDRVKNSLRTL